MLPEFAEGSPAWEAIFGASYFAISIVVALLIRLFFNKLIVLLTSRTRTRLDDLIARAISRPLFLFVLVFGPYTSLTAVTYLDEHQDILDRGLLAAEILIVGYAIVRVLNALFTWYAQEIASRTTSTWDERVLPVVRRIVNITAGAIIIILILDTQGLDINPLLAGLGIGGLAAALALQPTLSNLIAGTYTVTESRIGAGDYIELEGGPSGWVEDVGWRTTKIRTFYNNLVIIPNSKLADSIVTNYQGPDPSVFASVTCGVSYDSDLDRVGEVVLDLTNQILAESPGADLSYTPIVRFREFADSNINFMVFFKVRGFIDQFAIKDKIIRGIHRSFKEEGIEINYPVRKLVFPTEDQTLSLPLTGSERSTAESDG